MANQSARRQRTARRWREGDRYGGRGITICDRWLTDPAASMRTWDASRARGTRSTGSTTPRAMSPDNRWATRNANRGNRRSNRMREFRGESQPLAEWCERLGYRLDTVKKRLDAVCLRLDLHPATGPGAALCDKHSARALRFTSPDGLRDRRKRTQRWIETGGNVKPSAAFAPPSPLHQ